MSAAVGALFTTSAVVGSHRVNACRDYLESRSVPSPTPLVPVSSLPPASPLEAWSPAPDAPRFLPRPAVDLAPPIRVAHGEPAIACPVVGK